MSEGGKPASFAQYLRASLAVLEQLGDDSIAGAIEAAIDCLATALDGDRPVLVCGNGGSAADAMHLTGELVGRFMLERRALNAICLSANVSVLTSIGNDYSFDEIYSRQVDAHGSAGGVLVAISTSGRSANVIKAAGAARRRSMTVVAMTGAGGGDLAAHADILIAVPSRSTPLIQQAHLVAYHHICAAVERRLAVAG